LAFSPRYGSARNSCSRLRVEAVVWVGVGVEVGAAVCASTDSDSAPNEATMQQVVPAIFASLVISNPLSRRAQGQGSLHSRKPTHAKPVVMPQMGETRALCLPKSLPPSAF
jgi:hypothetical protein